MNPINAAVVRVIPLFPKKLVRVFANRYIAGDKLEDGVNSVKKLNSKNIMTTMDVLGESITTKEEAIESKNEAISVLEAIDKNKLNSNLSIKLTMMGLNLDFDFCYSLVKEIVTFAKEKNNFVRIDMEDSSVTEKTIQVFEKVRKDFENVGIAVQAYLRRTEKDIIRLSENGSNFRICKGIYIEPENIAFKNRNEIRENFLKVIRLALERKSYCGIATHDNFVTEGAKKIIHELGLKKDEYEFQMLLGVREKLRDELVNEGYRMRIYVPFGERWYHYSMRRFKENPNVMWAVMKSIIFRS